MKSIQILKQAETLQYQLTTIQTLQGNTIKWESYQRKDLHIPDFLRIIFKSKHKILIEKSFRPILDQECYGFISVLNTIDNPSDEQIKSQLYHHFELKENDIQSFKCLRYNHYANPDECNSSQWLCICEVNDIDELLIRFNKEDTLLQMKEMNNNHFVVIDTNDKRQLETFLNETSILFDEECYTFLFSFLHLQF